MSNATIDTQEQFMSASDVARLIGVHKMTVFKAAWSGELPSVKLRRRRLFRLSEIRRHFGIEEPQPTGQTSEALTSK
jgi:excisionase family DNA binding protein